MAVGSLSNNIISMNNLNPGPRIISTWKHGVPANKIAWERLKKGEGGLTAVEYGVRDSEGNANIYRSNDVEQWIKDKRNVRSS